MSVNAEAVPIEFTKEELEYLHTVIRHEVPDAERQWKFPPALLDLNEQIAFALETCWSDNFESVVMSLSKGDLLAIDYSANLNARTPGGVAVGRNVLHKVFTARKQLSLGMVIGADKAKIYDFSYEEVKKDGSPSTNAGPDTGPGTNAGLA